MTPDQPEQGDYGYDEAHAATGGESTPPQPPDRGPGPVGRRSGIPDLAGDYGYDEAHGF